MITKDSRVRLHFSLSLEDGSLIDSNFDKEAATFTMGDGSLLTGFEDVLIGLIAGQQASFVIDPEQGFGQYNPSNVQSMKRKAFPDDMELHAGLVVSFADVKKSELPGVIKSIAGDDISVDFNHPLAGKPIVFKVHLIDVVAAAAVTE